MVVLKAKNRSRNQELIIYTIYALLAASIILYIFTGITPVGYAAFILFIVVLVAEFRMSIATEGHKNTIKDVAIAVGAVVLIFIALAAYLQTSSPINVVASCSMLPVLHRGDLVVLHGIDNMSTFLNSHNIPVVNVTKNQFNNMVNNMQNEFVEPLAYSSNRSSSLYEILPKNYSGYTVGFFNLACISTQSQESSLSYNQCEVSQSNNLIKYNYAIAGINTSGGAQKVVYVPSIAIGNTTIVENYSNPIIVYKTSRQDYFTGDIIHRVFAAIRVGDEFYILTKGDNNPVLDIESFNYPENQSSVIGYVLADIPYLAYPSLIIKGQVGNVPGCNQTIVRN